MSRRALFQVHLWLGVALGLYISVVCLTGAALVFRIDLQRAVHPALLLPKQPGVAVEVPAVLRAIEAAWPRSRIVGIDAPTTSRPVYLAYVSDAAAFRTVLIDPSDGAILGELPDRSPIRILQELHFNLLAGETGQRVNGFGALCLLLLAASGAAIWWQGGGGRWRRGLVFRWQGNPGRRLWELHGAVGVWTVLVIALWAVTALSFTFPSVFRSAVNAVSTLSAPLTPPRSDPYQVRDGEAKSSWESIIARASWMMPGRYVARVVLPSTPTDAIQVLFASSRPTPAGTRKFETLYIDQYTGTRLEAPDGSARASAGDLIMEWVGPLHVGSFGGTAVKVAWLVLGLAPPLLFFTGLITWWRRVVRPWHRAPEHLRQRRTLA